MNTTRSGVRWFSVFLGLLVLIASSAYGQAAPNLLESNVPGNVPTRITQAIDEKNVVTLRGNIHPLARPQFDQGLSADPTPLNRMLLLLQRSPEQEAALQQLMTEQMSKASPNFHQWVTPQQFGQQFGPADADIRAVISWLASHGFTNVKVSQGRTVIEFSGNVGQVRDAFHTEIHRYLVHGVERIANANDPQIPAALAPVVAGIVSLNGFPVRSHAHLLGSFRKSRETGEVKPLFTFAGCGGNCFAVGPADFAVIYNTEPLLSASPKIDGTGQGIAVVGEQNINVQDVVDFRTMFGLSQNFSASNVIVNGIDPGVNGGDAETEADLDVEWSGAVAPGARIDFVTSASTETTSGTHLSAVYAVDHNLDPVLSESFGECEQQLGTAGNAFYRSLWQQAAAQGITVILSSGDGGSAGCDDFSSESAADQGLAVSGLASTPYNVAVGGTDFDQLGRQSQFWNTAATSTATEPIPASAKSYVPEETWNESCAAGGLGSCTAANALGIVAGSGGASTVYSKPSWQVGVGVPSDGHRDLPDVSLFASPGHNGSFYVVCQADADGGNPCSLQTLTFQAVGGTSASAPAFAGIMALVNQKQATAQNPEPRQGIANYVLYGLGQQQTSANLNCNSSSSPVASCDFHDVTKGNNSVPCVGGSLNCSAASANGTGELVTAAAPNTPAYTATAGYDLATGLGSVNASNIAENWGTVNTTPSTTSLTLNNGSAVNVTHGTAVPFRVSVTPTVATGDVALIAAPGPGNSIGVGPFTLSSGVASGMTTALPGGTAYNVMAHYQGNGTDAPSDSAPVIVTITPEGSRPTITIPTFDFTTGAETIPNATSIAYGSPYIIRVDVGNGVGTKCDGTSVACPTGTVTLTDNGHPLDAGTFTLNSAGFSEDQHAQVSQQLTGGTHTIAASYAGDGSYNASTAADAIAITPAPTTSAFVGLPPSLDAGGGADSFDVQLTAQSYGTAPTGTVTLFDGTIQLGGAVNILGSSGTLFGTLAHGNVLMNGVIGSSGKHTITAKYSGDANYAPSAVSQTLSAFFLPTVIATPATVNAPYQVPITLTAIVDTSVANLAPTGTLSFADASGTYAGPVTYTTVTGPSGNAALQATITGVIPPFTETIFIQYSGDSNYRAAGGGVSVTVIVPDFSMSFNPPGVTLTAGQPANTTLTVAPLTSSSTAVALSCLSSSLTVGVNCAVSPASVNLANNTSKTAAVTLTAAFVPTSTSAVVSEKKRAVIHVFVSSRWGPRNGAAIAVFLSLIVLAYFARRARLYRLAAALGASALIVVVLGCGGGAAGSAGGGGGTGGTTGGGGGGGSTTPGATSITISVSSNKIAAGTSLTATATVTGSHPLTGYVSFFDSVQGVSQSFAVTNGVAQGQIQMRLVGFHRINASYSGDVLNSPSNSSPITVEATGTATVAIVGATGPLSHVASVEVSVQ